MTKLINNLKEQHKTLTTALESVRTAGLSTKAGRDKLVVIKRDLINHLKLEDERLYPVLKKAAATNGMLKGLLDMFSTDMDSVNTMAIDFFRKYSDADDNILQTSFTKDFDNIMGALKVRIQREENMLYMEFQRLREMQ